MSISVGAGAAMQVSAVAGVAPRGNVARPVHTYHVVPSAGVLGVPVAQPVVYLNASDLVQNGGTYYLEGMPVAMPVYDGHALNLGAGAPLPVYEVTDPFPNPPIGPLPPTPPPSTASLISEDGKTLISESGLTLIAE